VPRQRQQRTGQLAGYWLSRRPNSAQWCRTWFDAETRQTRRASLGTDDLAAAERALAEWITRNVATDRAEPREITLARVFARYYERHGQHLVGASAQRISLAMMLRYLPEGITVGELNRDAQEAGQRAMRAAGYNDWTIKRAFGAAKAAVNWAWANNELDRPIPFIKLPEGRDRERVLTVKELSRLWDQEMPDHLRAFLAVLIGTAGRPEAILQLTRFQCDLAARTMDMNPPGRTQTKKRRPVLPIPNWLVPWIEAADGHLVSYRGKPVKKIAGAFQTMRDTAGFGPDVTAYTVRHTIASTLLKRGVDLTQISVVLGHQLPGSRSTRRYVHVDPDYLAGACAALDDLANDIARAATRAMLPTNLRDQINNQRASSVLVPQRKGCNPTAKPLTDGAGEGIRTLDPNLGKVVLYP
jgi:integrase